jgi:hypothetical protein
MIKWQLFCIICNIGEHLMMVCADSIYASGEELIEVLGGASVTTSGSRCSKTRALNDNAVVLVSKGEVTIQVKHIDVDDLSITWMLTT